ncbi:MAG: PilZ domain-containing protein [Desulfobacterales bacterium]|nr:MAG: PilZ domain-containing protein [Desulfobacterales bacterium]
MSDFIEKRKNPRVEVRWPIKVSTNEGLVEGETVNISLDGVSIYCSDPLPFNEVLSISIEPLNQSVIELSGKVIWSDSFSRDEGQSYAIGVSFLEITDEDRQRFTQFRDLVSFLFR